MTLLQNNTPKVANKIVAFFDPAVYWVARWMPVFFVPSLVVLPLSAAMFSSQQLASVGVAIAGAWAITLLAAAGTAKTLRHFLHTELTTEEVRSDASAVAGATFMCMYMPYAGLHFS
jgi:hypothetical protein